MDSKTRLWTSSFFQATSLKSRKKKMRFLLLIFTFAISSCGFQNKQALEKAASEISDNLGCKNSKSQVFDAFYNLVDGQKSLPRAEELKEILGQKIEDSYGALDTRQGLQVQQLKNELNKIVDTMLSASIRNPKINWQEQIQEIIKYEMGDQTTKKNESQLALSFANIKKLEQNLMLSCSQGEVAPPKDIILLPENAKMIKGLSMVFATAYQSCSVLQLPEMNRQTPDTQGISVIGKHPDGVGSRREVTNLSDLQSTHYYIRTLASESNCRSVKNSPLIYDYGGQPKLAKNEINFFENSGSGTKALGIDCSAFVSSAVAVAGLRYKPGLPNKTIYIRQASSQFIDANQSGFTCFQNIEVTPQESVKVGDIVAVKGHVVVIDTVGSDPFGLEKISSQDLCNKIDYKNFDMVISQSSPSKNGIGINRYVVKDYLAEAEKMKNAFVEMARSACLAKFQKRSIKPASTDWGFIRHKGTPECFDRRVMMTGEECTQKCF